MASVICGNANPRTTPSRLLLVYPQFSMSYMGYQYSMPFLGRKALMPPLGLLTIAALTPPRYEFRLVDLNCAHLTDADLDWADVVLFSAMLTQKASLTSEARRAKRAGKLVVIGGPYATGCPDECMPFADVLVLNEGEITWPKFLADLEAGMVKPRYSTEQKADVSQSPCPRFDLIEPSNYLAIPVQFSRGCPYQCEFCDIIVMYGRVPRVKSPEQFLSELNALHETGYRGLVFVADDNFIGNKKKVLELLPELRAWNVAHGDPFSYATQASVNLADDERLMAELRETHFRDIFLGIETPSSESLKEIKKTQNVSRDLKTVVHDIQRAGFTVSGGFIVGFDHDTEDIFQRQIDFINDTAITIPFVCTLIALPKTPLHERLKKEGRLANQDDDNRTVGYGLTNFKTTLPPQTLVRGYREVLKTLFTPSAYFARARRELERVGSGIEPPLAPPPIDPNERLDGVLTELGWSVPALTTIFRQFPREYRKESLRFAFDIAKPSPRSLDDVLMTIFLGFHAYMFTFKHLLPDLDRVLAGPQATPTRMPTATAELVSAPFRPEERPSPAAY